jgi:hypothetical protein
MTIRRRTRIASLENAARGIIGLPGLLPAIKAQPADLGFVSSHAQASTWANLTTGRGSADSLRLVLGPVVVRSQASLEMRVFRADGTVEDIDPAAPRLEVGLPQDPFKRAEAVLWLMGATTFGGWLGDLLMQTRPGVVLGAVVGYGWAARTWNKWQGSG